MARWARVLGLVFAILSLPFSFYFGGYPGFLFFKSFHWFPVGLTLRANFGVLMGILLAVFIFWAFGTVLGAYLWWLFHERKKGGTSQ